MSLPSAQASTMSEPLFTPTEARVIAALVEKSLTTPQYYPLTEKALQAACNQKSCRNPLMSLSDGAVGQALRTLEERGFCRRDESSPRSVKWRHQFNHQMLLQPATQAVLVTLMLRGPQTVAELRSHAQGLKGPLDTAGIQEQLELLSDRAEPLVKVLERSAGQKESRYAHLLCGEDEIPAATPAAPRASQSISDDAARIEALEARLEALEHRLAALEAS